MDSIINALTFVSNLSRLTPSAAFACMVCFIIFNNSFNHVVRKRQRNRHRNRQHALDEMDKMDDKHFKRMFRLSRHSFQILLDKLIEE